MENNFENKMENLETPKTDFVKHQEMFKIGLMNAKKSARIGILFIVIPLLLIFLAYLKIKLLIHFDFFRNIEHFISKQDQMSYFNWISHIFLIGLPILAIIINLLAITHFYINKQNKELIITIQYRLKNIIVLIISWLLLVSLYIYILF